MVSSTSLIDYIRYNEVLVDVISTDIPTKAIMTTIELNCESGMMSGEEYFQDQKYTIGIGKMINKLKLF